MKRHETNLPAQQTPPQKDHRFSRSYEDRGRPEGDQSPPQSGAQKARRLSYPKEIRLLSRRDFQKVLKEGKRLIGRFLCVDCRNASKLKLGISASSRYGSAPERNRFKRLVREAFRQHYTRLPSLELNVIPRQLAKEASLHQIAEELTHLLR